MVNHGPLCHSHRPLWVKPLWLEALKPKSHEIESDEVVGTWGGLCIAGGRSWEEKFSGSSWWVVPSSVRQMESSTPTRAARDGWSTDGMTEHQQAPRGGLSLRICGRTGPEPVSHGSSP